MFGAHDHHVTNIEFLSEQSPTIEVRAYRNGVVIHSELCESEEQAALVVDEWSEHPGVTCEVDDLSVRLGPGDTLDIQD